MSFLRMVVSGGQTGVDQAALRAARRLGLATGGWMPAGFRTDDGPRPDVAAAYGLSVDPSPTYPPRTERCVRAAGATLVMGDRGSPGCALTVRLCRGLAKPHLCVARGDDRELDAAAVRGFLERVRPTVLNVAGNRERTHPGVGAWAEAVLERAFGWVT